MAEAAGITLIGIAREDAYEIFTHPERIVLRAVQHVA
jgi:FdhD protein